MRRQVIPPRILWEAKVEEHGLVYHTHEGKPYWFEGAFYEFTEAEIDTIEEATEELHRLCLQAVAFAVEHDRLTDLGVPHGAQEAVKASWRAQPPRIYGRFDLVYDGIHPPKMLEYNADTPTALLEAATIQWYWLQDQFPGADQFNSIWEGLVERWKRLREARQVKGHVVHFAHQESLEDLMTVTLLRDAAEEAGLLTEGLHIEEIGWDPDARRFVDLQNYPIGTLFKLYPWEWMLRDEFGANAVGSTETQWIEPLWKLMLSSKAILALLWELNPGHPNLLPAYLDGPRDLAEYVEKPIFAREGANIRIVGTPDATASSGPYGQERSVYQAYQALSNFDGNRPILGSWVIGDQPRGMGIRETDGPITDDLARFVPHLFR